MSYRKLPAEDPIIAWEAMQQAHPERGKAWYVIATAVILALLGYSIMTQAWTFTILIVVLGAWYWKAHSSEPPRKQMRIWKRGFAVNDDYYDWGQCTGYWIFRTKHYSELHIDKANGGEIKIQTGELNPYQIQEIMAPFLPEETDRREHVLDTIIRICKL